MKIHVINGPNLNMIGIRETQIYGDKRYAELVAYIKEKAKQKGINVQVLQSNYEGRLVTAIQKSKGVFDAIIINAAAYTHTSIAILDALKAANLPAVEVHLSNLILREDFRAFSYIALYTDKTIMGKGFEGYNEALDYLFDRYGHL
jgi:3-dehydroquinate dehydratase-2